ncbi:MAG: hypothetical protein WCD53_29900 [Microcoleus sp.]
MGIINDGIKKASEASRGKIEAKRKIGDAKAKGSIDKKGVIELGVDFKVGGLGITTDYGGGIKVSIAGQSITWGKTGGKIHYNIGGFELIVEARKCIVTETKKIMGIVVASHTYPDPGCKLPEPPKPPDPPQPPNSVDPIAVPVPDTGNGWVFVHVKSESIDGRYISSSDKYHLLSIFIRKIVSPIEERIQGSVGNCPMDIEFQHFYNSERTVYPKGTKIWVHRIPVYDTVGWVDNLVPLHTELASNYACSHYFMGDAAPLYFWGAFKDIKRFL